MYPCDSGSFLFPEEAPRYHSVIVSPRTLRPGTEDRVTSEMKVTDVTEPSFPQSHTSRVGLPDPNRIKPSQTYSGIETDPSGGRTWWKRVSRSSNRACGRGRPRSCYLPVSY